MSNVNTKGMDYNGNLSNIALAISISEATMKKMCISYVYKHCIISVKNKMGVLVSIASNL